MSNSALHPIHTDQAPAAISPYSQAVSANFAFKGTVVFCSGQIGLDPATGNLRDGFEAQVDQALANMQAVIKGRWRRSVRHRQADAVPHRSRQLWRGQRQAGSAAAQAYPARSTVGVASLPKGAQFEIEAIVVV